MNKKTEKKKQEKVIEDRTFGLKNKNKSKAVQKYYKIHVGLSKELNRQSSSPECQCQRWKQTNLRKESSRKSYSNNRLC